MEGGIGFGWFLGRGFGGGSQELEDKQNAMQRNTDYTSTKCIRRASFNKRATGNEHARGFGGALGGRVTRAGGERKRNTTNVDYTSTKCTSRAVFNVKTDGSEHAHVHFPFFYIQKGCRYAFRRGEIAPKFARYAVPKKC